MWCNCVKISWKVQESRSNVEYCVYVWSYIEFLFGEKKKNTETKKKRKERKIYTYDTEVYTRNTWLDLDFFCVPMRRMNDFFFLSHGYNSHLGRSLGGMWFTGTGGMVGFYIKESFQCWNESIIARLLRKRSLN